MKLRLAFALIIYLVSCQDQNDENTNKTYIATTLKSSTLSTISTAPSLEVDNTTTMEASRSVDRRVEVLDGAVSPKTRFSRLVYVTMSAGALMAMFLFVSFWILRRGGSRRRYRRHSADRTHRSSLSRLTSEEGEPLQDLRQH
ncbi:hypothetical protein ACOME3_006299 [Neoechinorhynchus agilis]